MNTYIKMQLQTMIQYVDSFQQACEIAAMKDDGVIDKKEQKQLKKIRKAVSRFKRIWRRYNIRAALNSCSMSFICLLF